MLPGWDGGEGEEVFVSIVLMEITSSEQRERTRTSAYVVCKKFCYFYLFTLNTLEKCCYKPCFVKNIKLLYNFVR